MKRPRGGLRIAHLHVWDKKNKGDVAIVLAVQELLRKRFPSSRISDFPVSLLKEGRRKDVEKINRCDLVIIGGGGIFYSYFFPYSEEFIRAIKKPIILFGVGYIKEVDAPEPSSEALRGAALLAKAAKAVGVRDQRTKDWLAGKGVPAGHIKVIGDPAALLAEKRPPASTRKKMGLDENGVIRIGLNLNYSGWLGFGKWRDDILSAYRSVADHFREEYGDKARFYYLKHHPGENDIYPELGIKDLTIVDLKPAEQKYVYGRLDLVIGMMLHAGVLAFGASTPEISVAYDLRNHSFAEYIVCPELVVDLDDLRRGRLLKLVRSVFKKKTKYRKYFLTVKEKTYRKQEHFLIRLGYD